MFLVILRLLFVFFFLIAQQQLISEGCGQVKAVVKTGVLPFYIQDLV